MTLMPVALALEQLPTALLRTTRMRRNPPRPPPPEVPFQSIPFPVISNVARTAVSLPRLYLGCRTDTTQTPLARSLPTFSGDVFGLGIAAPLRMIVSVLPVRVCTSAGGDFTAAVHK